jgi:hypothetical protein
MAATRREFLKTGMIAGAGIALPGISFASSASTNAGIETSSSAPGPPTHPPPHSVSAGTPARHRRTSSPRSNWTPPSTRSP